MTSRRAAFCALLAVSLIASGACSTDSGCDGSLVESEGPIPTRSYWSDPFKGEVVDSTADADLPFEPIEPSLALKVNKITWTRGENRLAGFPGATVGPRIAWAYETPDGPFFVQQALVGYGQPKLEQEASECEVSESHQSNPGFSMTELDEDHDALLIAQSLVMSVVWIDEATITDESRVPGDGNVVLETQIRAPGDELTVNQLLDIANYLQD